MLLHRPAPRPIAGGLRLAAGLAVALAACAHDPPRPAAPVVAAPAVTEPAADTPKIEVLHCLPADLPEALARDQIDDLGRGAQRWAETRDTALGALGLLLGTGAWASPVSVQPQRGPIRAATSDECRALREANPGRLFHGRAIAAILDYDYQPRRGAAPTVQVRVLGLLSAPDGAVRVRTVASAATDYASVSLGYHERSSQEVAQELVQQIAAALRPGARHE